MTGTHIITSQDPQQVLKDVAKFSAGKTAVIETWSTTLVVVGLLPGGQANLMVFTSCLIMWECTDDDWKSYLFTQQMALKKVV